MQFDVRKGFEYIQMNRFIPDKYKNNRIGRFYIRKMFILHGHMSMK